MIAGRTPIVSVIVPTFNRAMFISETLDSVMPQLRSSDEIIVVDDGSTDSTPSLMQSGAWPIRYFRQENAGKSAAVEYGIAEANGDLIWIVDDDDIMAVGALEAMRKPLEMDIETGFTFGAHNYLIKKNGVWVQQRTPLFDRPCEPLHLSLLRRCFFFQSGMLVRRKCYDAVGSFDLSLRRSQDYDMILRLSRLFKGVEVPGPLFHQRQHDGQRGAHEAAIAANNRDAAWMKYDGQIFDRIFTTYPLKEFEDLVRHRAHVEPFNLEISARVARATVMARRALWGHAAADINAIADIMRSRPKARLSDAELYDLSTIYSWAGYGLLGATQANSFFEALANLPRKERIRALRSLSQPLLGRLKTSIRNKDYRLAKLSVRTARKVGQDLIKSYISVI